MLKQRNKLLLAILTALFIAITLGEQRPVPVLNWWCAAFPGQSPVTYAGEEVVYRLWIAELISKMIL